MRKRYKLGRKKSGRMFTKNARRFHKKNVGRPMRGGIRL